MTVAELRAVLAQYPDEMLVGAYDTIERWCPLDPYDCPDEQVYLWHGKGWTSVLTLNTTDEIWDGGEK